MKTATPGEDFIHKLKVCLKELRETRRWARLIARMKWTEGDATLRFILNESEELIRIFTSSVKTAHENSLKQKRSSNSG